MADLDPRLTNHEVWTEGYADHTCETAHGLFAEFMNAARKSNKTINKTGSADWSNRFCFIRDAAMLARSGLAVPEWKYPLAHRERTEVAGDDDTHEEKGLHLAAGEESIVQALVHGKRLRLARSLFGRAEDAAAKRLVPQEHFQI